MIHGSFLDNKGRLISSPRVLLWEIRENCVGNILYYEFDFRLIDEDGLYRIETLAISILEFYRYLDNGYSLIGNHIRNHVCEPLHVPHGSVRLEGNLAAMRVGYKLV